MDTYIKLVIGEYRHMASSVTDTSQGRIYWIGSRGYLIPWSFVNG